MRMKLVLMVLTAIVAMSRGDTAFAQPGLAQPSTTLIAAKPAKSKATPPKPTEKNPFIEPMVITRVAPLAEACLGPCPDWIAAEGRIVAGQSAAQLRRVIRSFGKAKPTIVIASPGGSVEEGYAMARVIREHGLDVVVARTELIACATTDKDCESKRKAGTRFGRLLAATAPCASSCVFVLAGGVKRHVGPQAIVGVHQYQSTITLTRFMRHYRIVTDPRTGRTRKETTAIKNLSRHTETRAAQPKAYAKSEAFFREMGVDASIMVPIRETPHERMTWLSRSQLDQTKIATDRRSPYDVIGVRSTSIAAVAAAPFTNTGDAIVRGVRQHLSEMNCLRFSPSMVWDEALRGGIARLATITGLAPAADQPSVHVLEWLIKLRATPSIRCASPAPSQDMLSELHGAMTATHCLPKTSPMMWGPPLQDALQRYAVAARTPLDAREADVNLLATVLTLRKDASITCQR